MDDTSPPKALAYRSPVDDRQANHAVCPMSRRRVDATGLAVGMYQSAYAVALMTTWTDIVTEGWWPAVLLWPYGLTITAGCNAAATACLLWGAIAKPSRRGRWYGRFVFLALVTMVLAGAGVALAKVRSIFVSDHPHSPAVNDHRLYVTNDTFRMVSFSLLFAWPMFVVLLDRRSRRRTRRKRVRLEIVRRRAINSGQRRS